MVPFKNYLKGGGGGASGRAAASWPDNPSVIPLGAGLFSLSINQWHFLNQVPCGGATLTDFPKIGLAVQLEANQAW